MMPSVALRLSNAAGAPQKTEAQNVDIIRKLSVDIFENERIHPPIIIVHEQYPFAFCYVNAEVACLSVLTVVAPFDFVCVLLCDLFCIINAGITDYDKLIIRECLRLNTVECFSDIACGIVRRNDD